LWLAHFALPKRWIIERAFAWVSSRRLAKEFERYARTAGAFVRLAMLLIMAQAASPKCLIVNLNFTDGLLHTWRT